MKNPQISLNCYGVPRVCLLHLCGIGGSVDHICTTWKKRVMMIFIGLLHVQNFDLRSSS